VLRQLRRSVDALIRRTRFEREMRDEIRQHLDDRTHDLIESGISPSDAARQARVEFGAMERYKEQCRDARGFAAFRPLHGLGGDVKLAARRLLATPQFLIFAVLSLAIGIGVTTSVYSILYSLVWKPIGVAEPSRVMRLSGPGSRGGPGRMYLSTPDFEDLKASARTFSALTGSARFYQALVTPESSEALEGEAVTGEYFRALGVSAALGRTIQPRDDETAARVIVLNYRVWTGRFGRDPRIVGRVVRLGGQPFEVIGVASRSYDGLERMLLRTGGWIPLRATSAFATAGAASAPSRERRQLTVLGRLMPAQTAAGAAGEVAAIAARLDSEFPLWSAPISDRPRAKLSRGWLLRSAEDTDRSVDRVAALVLGLVALVLVVACTNLANLVMARGATRQRDIAVRRALGANRWRLVRELLAEGVIVAALGGALSLAIMRVLLVLSTVEVPTPGRTFTLEPELNFAAVAAASAALLLSLLVFALEPALQLTRARVSPDLSGGDATVGVVRSGRERAFIRWQVATSVTFFLIAAVLARVIVTEARHDPGIDLDRLALAAAYLPPHTWDQARALRVMTGAADQLRSERGIESVALSSGVPFGLPGTTWAQATTPDRPFTASGQFEMTTQLASTPEIFRTLGVPIVRGRAFDERDDAGAPRVMVVSEKTARTFFGTADAVGRQLTTRAWGRPPAETYTIVGVSRDTDSGHLMSRNNETVYVPLAQHYEPLFVIVARTSGNAANAARLIQGAVRRADPDVALGTSGPASILLSGPYFVARIAASLAAALGALTLVLAMIGLYGVQGHLVARRTREIGVRMAIGATRDEIERMVLREGVRPVIEGIVLGTVLAVLARIVLRALVSGNVPVVDAIAFGVVPIPLIIAACVACYLPARRAARVDPNVALRHL
jgi:putative ABC transport system permease protein